MRENNKGNYALDGDNVKDVFIQEEAENNITLETFWNSEGFNELIKKKGYAVALESALKCPCGDISNAQPQNDCLNCGGSGWIFINKRQTIIGATGFKANTPRIENWSEIDDSTVNLVYRPADKLGFMDKVTFIELEAWCSQILFLSEVGGDYENYLKEKITNLDFTKKIYWSFLTYSPITVYEVFLFISKTEPLLFLEKDKDYHIVDNKIVVTKSIVNFLGNSKNMNITIRYTHNPVYHILSINRDLIKQNDSPSCSGESQYKNLPLSAIAKKSSFIIDAVNFNGGRLYDNSINNPISKDYNSKLRENKNTPIPTIVKENDIYTL